ncbi:glycosyltransferase [Pedobacter frigoris]|uniref:glycosyltransferase n=1 Tax=Pedobacter frigoris TaxID=2571272 RepID=UPI00292D457B|nr:glycosyltransferase [Pedobacter frigoris]
MTLFFTIVTANYLPFAVSLLDSAKVHHPEFEFCICLTDYVSSELLAQNELMKKYPVLQLHEIKAEEFDFITTNYNPMQLANSSKILFASYFLNEKEFDQVIFADSDMLFFNRLPDSIINSGDILFTPHFTSPPPLEMKRQELEVLNAGLLNGGFFILRRSEDTNKFITWLRERSVKDCVYDFSRGIYGEQLWLNLIPLYFNNVSVETNKGLNVAYWNLHERIISEDNGTFFVNETTPLYFFHYSGWDYNDPLNISKWGLITTEMRPDIKPLLISYREALKKNQYEAYINMPNYYTANNNSKKKSFFRRLKNKLTKK